MLKRAFKSIFLQRIIYKRVPSDNSDYKQMKYFVLLLLIAGFNYGYTQDIEIKSLVTYTTDERLALPVLTGENKFVVEFDVKSEFEPFLSILFRFCDEGWMPTNNIFLLNQNNNFKQLYYFDRLPVTVEDSDYHFIGSFPDKDGFIVFPFSGKWRFYITDSQDTSLVYADGRFFVVSNEVILGSTIRRDELEDKNYWPVELAKVFNITTNFYLPDDFFPSYVDRLEIIQNRNIYEPIIIERNANTLVRQFKWDANKKFTYITRDIPAGNEYRQVDIRNFNFFTTKDVKAQRDGLEFSRFFLTAQPDLNGNSIYMDHRDLYATYLNVTFSIRPPDEVISDIFIVGAFNNWQLSAKYKLKYEAGVHSITIPLKRGIYDYQYVVGDEINGDVNNADWLVLEGNTWDNLKEYDIFLYYNEPSLGGYERIIGYVKLPGKQN